MRNLAANAPATVVFRIERCGAHARKDFPDRDDQGSLAHTLARANGLERAPGDPTDLPRPLPTRESI